MKKTTKLLSVLLAVVMMMSCFTMAAFAAKTNYQTSSNLTSLGAYSPDGAVTRLSTEERMSILMDFLDRFLATVEFNEVNVSKMGISIYININSIDNICKSLDSIKSAKSSVGILSGLLGDLNDLNTGKWTSGMTRTGTAQLSIIKSLLDFLGDNKTLVGNVITNGKLDLGLASSALPASINEVLSDIPKLIRSKVWPLLSRRDDTKTIADNYYAGNGNISDHLNTLVNTLFKNPQSDTTYKENASGTCISSHSLPTSSQNLRYYFTKSGSGDSRVITRYIYDPEKKVYNEDQKFYRVEESTGVYTFKANDGEGLKWFKDGSYWLPSLKAANPTINVNSQSAATLLYTFAPYVFKDLALIPLNGFIKQMLATWMGATETKVFEGTLTEGKASAYYASLPQAAKDMFGADVPYYQFAYSAYEAMDNADIQYYRYVDKDTNIEEWFEIDMTTGNDFLDMFDLTYEITGDFMNEFIPSSATATKTLFQSLNDFLCKVASTVLKDSVYSSLGLQTGDNAYLVSNLRKAIQTVLPVQPDAILGPDYLVHYDGYYQTLIDTSASNDEVLSALAAIIAKALMPQLILPSAANLAGQKVGAVLACVVRELVTQFVPTYNYDALIFTNYNTRTLVSGKDNSYWLDVILTMGVDVGMTYLDNLADLGRDVTSGTNKGYQVAASKTYSLSTFESNPQAWEDNVDWIIDWALTNSVEWGWNMSNLVNISGLTTTLSSAQDPWTKLEKILVYDSSSNTTGLLPLKEIINCSAASDKTWLETVLRDKLILGIADLKFEYIFGKGTNYTASGNAGLISIPSNSVLRTTGAIPAIWQIVRDLLNRVLYKVGGNANLIAAGTFTSIDTLLDTKAHLKTLINQLQGMLPNAHTNGLWQTVLPILEMFIGWKTDSQEFVDPEITWSAPYLLKTSSNNDGITMNIKNNSAGMLLKLVKGNTVSYEAAYNIVIKSISGSGLTAPSIASSGDTIAPWGEKSYTIKASSTPSSDTATQLVITYEVQGKSGAAIGGTRYLSTYLIISPNTSDIGTTLRLQYDGSGCSTHMNADWVGTQNALCLYEKDIDEVLTKNVWYNLENWDGDYTLSVTAAGYTGVNNLQFGSGTRHAVNDTIDKYSDPDPGVKTYYPVTKGEDFTYVTGTAYNLGKPTFTLKANNETMTSDQGKIQDTSTTAVPDLGKFYYADLTELGELFNAELAKNRVSSQYSNATMFAAYVTAMKNASLLINAPVMTSTFATKYTETKVSDALTDLQDAVDDLDTLGVQVADVTTILNNGLAATEVSGFIGADDQINFQDYTLYNYWRYEKNRTEARDIIKQYEQPTEPGKFIEGCWLPYTDTSGKNEDLATVINGISNTTKKNAVIASLSDPDAKTMQAYYQAAAEWNAPEYSALYAEDIAQKLSLFKGILVDRSYSKVAAGRVQLAQEIAYANAQNYNQADYTAVSWARYQDALTKATAANTDGTMQSFVFQAKYDLLVAQRQLRLKAYDWATQYGWDDINANIALAEGMFANAEYFTAVDGTLDTEWTDLIEALGYTANFGTGSDAWSMNLYEKSAGQLISEEIDTRSGRNAARVTEVATALQNAINALKCTIEVIKNDATTVVTQESKFITNLTPGTLAIANDVLAHVKASATAATLAVTGTDNGFGTGTIVAATLNSIPLANYYVVIYGDVNGDNFIDGFDAVKADRRLTAGTAFSSAPVEAAADATKDGVFEAADIGAIINAAAGLTEINQA